MKIKNNVPFQVVVNGQTFDARVENVSANPLVVFVNGNPYTIELPQETLPDSFPAPAAPAALAVPTPPSQPAKTVSPAPSGVFSITAPMPGTIQGISVKVGQAVHRGDQLCQLEAMKMKNAIRSPRDGIVGSIDVNEDQKVTYGELLFTLK